MYGHFKYLTAEMELQEPRNRESSVLGKPLADERHSPGFAATSSYVEIGCCEMLLALHVGIPSSVRTQSTAT